MKRILFRSMALIILMVPLILSCQRIDVPQIEGELTTIELTNLKGIPLEYGKLVSVTSPSSHPDWAHLWFEDDKRTIRMVRIGFADDRLHEKVTVIPRN